MQRAVVFCLLGAAASCSDGSESATEIVDAQVSWMEWPAEVVAGAPFVVRLAGYGVDCRQIEQFSLAPSVDNSAVTFTPYFVVSTAPQPCPLAAASVNRVAAGPVNPLAPNFDTVATVPGLAAQTPRTYEMRAAANVGVLAASSSVPTRTFGTILVRIDSADGSSLNAGGSVYAYRDTLGCLRVSPLYVVFFAAGPPVGPSSGYVVENPPDTSSYWSGFVRGYLVRPPGPVCGDTLVFHLVTKA